MPNDQFKRRLFKIISRVALASYGRFPVFGPLRASIGILRNDGRYLAIDRSDGRGYSLPGGLAFLGEEDEAVLRREIAEETGLSVVSAKLVLRYFSHVEIPCHVAVFDVEAKGTLRGSWEGSPVWATFAELQERILLSQRRVTEALLVNPAMVGESNTQPT